MTVQNLAYWRGKLVDDMTTEELREALKECGALYTQALERAVSIHETTRLLYRRRK